MTSINHAELSPWAIPGYWLAHDSTDSGSQHYQLCWVTANHKRRIIRRTCQDYIQTGRRLPENQIYVHALRNAINPDYLLGFELAGLLSGAFIAEFFSSIGLVWGD